MADPKPLSADLAPTFANTGVLTHHGLGCRCWPHVSEQDALDAIAAAALAEYRDGKRRVEPAPEPTAALHNCHCTGGSTGCGCVCYQPTPSAAPDPLDEVLDEQTLADWLCQAIDADDRDEVQVKSYDAIERMAEYVFARLAEARAALAPAEPRPAPAGLDGLREALTAIRDMEPEDVPGLPDHEGCAECARRAKAGWPPSGMCEDRYRQFSNRDRSLERSVNAQQWRMRDIARAALARSDAP
jgi:hypothetical protein